MCIHGVCLCIVFVYRFEVFCFCSVFVFVCVRVFIQSLFFGFLGGFVGLAVCVFLCSGVRVLTCLCVRVFV